MNITKTTTISYSPTRTSFKIADAIQRGSNVSNTAGIDLTYPGFPPHSCVAGELAIIAMPVYGGRVAPLGAARFASVQGNGCPAIIVVVYGNRDFEDALIELRDIAENQGFKVVAAAAFIGEHSFSSPAMPIAEGRPDRLDLARAEAFGNETVTSLKSTDDLRTLPPLKVPGKIPYKEGAPKKPFTPQVAATLCTSCGACMPTCPNEAISLHDCAVIEMEKCTFCCACMKICPENAITINQTPAQQWVEMLHARCNTRKEPQLFCR